MERGQYFFPMPPLPLITRMPIFRELDAAIRDIDAASPQPKWKARDLCRQCALPLGSTERPAKGRRYAHKACAKDYRLRLLGWKPVKAFFKPNTIAPLFPPDV